LQQHLVFAKTPQEIAKLAESVTVQINGKTSGSGTGFIIAKQGTTYTVLTANHVVADTKDTYTIRTHTKKDYPVTRSVLLQKGQNAPDLAVVTFNSAESYPVVTLGDSEQAAVGTEIFVFGYPANPPSRKVWNRIAILSFHQALLPAVSRIIHAVILCATMLLRKGE
jgi:serine protease Do